MRVERGKLRLSDRVIFGLLAVAIVAPENVGQRVPPSYVLTFAGQSLPINDWWGRPDDFVTLLSTERMPSVKLDFAEWMKVAT
jgi:hypothetical protein